MPTQRLSMRRIREVLRLRHQGLVVGGGNDYCATRSNGVAREHQYYHAMRQVLPKSGNLVSSWMIFPLACALVVIGAKCWMIAHYGSPTPYWDQWDAEGAFLYPKYFGGTLQISDLIAPHNEHRILVTRLWSLLLLELGGYWDPILQMVANTLILGAAVALLVISFQPILDRRLWIAFTLFTTAVFALPSGWENTLCSFQSPWYFMLLFSIGGLVAIVDAPTFTTRWWLAMLLLILSYFSIASGALSMAAAFAICLVQTIVRRRSGLREWLALAVLAALTVVMVWYIPMLPYHAPLKAHSIGQFLQAMMEIASWPAALGRATVVKLLCAIIIHAPALLASIYVIRQRPPLADRRWLLVALTGWVALQAAATAYGRATGPTASRYLDVFAIALPLNEACLLHFWHAPEKAWLRRLAFSASAVWLLLVLLSLTAYTVKRSLPDMADWRATGQDQTKNLRAYLDTGDISALENKPYQHIPYPDANRLAMIVSQPVIRALLPPALVGEASAGRAQQRGLARFTGHAVEAIKEYALRWGALLMPAGIILFVIGLAAHRRRREEPTPPRT